MRFKDREFLILKHFLSLDEFVFHPKCFFFPYEVKMLRSVFHFDVNEKISTK